MTAGSTSLQASLALVRAVLSWLGGAHRPCTGLPAGPGRPCRAPSALGSVLAGVEVGPQDGVQAPSSDTGCSQLTAEPSEQEGREVNEEPDSRRLSAWVTEKERKGKI